MARVFLTVALAIVVALALSALVAGDRSDTSALRARVWTQPMSLAPLNSDVMSRFDKYKAKNGFSANLNTLMVFRENIARIVAYNNLAKQDSLPVAVLSTTGPFAGMTSSEFMATRLGLVPQISTGAKRTIEQKKAPSKPRVKPAPKPAPKPRSKPAKPVKPVKPVKPTPKPVTPKVPARHEPVAEPLPPPPAPPRPPLPAPPKPDRPVVVPPPPPPPVVVPPPPPPTYDMEAGAVDWRKQNVLTPVVNQANCGSCWAFSACATLEAAFALRGKTAPVKLSEQHLIDCNKGGRNGNIGCDGGSYITAMEFVRTSGIAYASAYPYAAVDQNCSVIDKSNIAGHVKGRNWIKGYQPILDAVKLGPISAGVQAADAVWQHYKSGVIMATDCDNTYDANHAINIVGYGVYQGVDVWVIRNSWGEKWGMKGYAYLERGAKNACRINDEGMVPVL